jgi:adenylate cyclase
MKEELKKLNQKLNLPFELKNGIGIHFGEVVIGNVGAPFRMDYTAIGDTVNTSSRVEHLTRDLNQEILVTETVYEMAGDTFIFEAMGDFSVKGKSKPLKLYSLKGRKNDKQNN